MAKLFLSYSRKDAGRARRFTEWLERQGHDVWRDDDDIGGGASFSSEIEKALNECDAVLVLWSADSVQSAWVRDEAGFGRDSGKLIPFSLDGTAPPLGFRQFQSIDLSRWRRSEPSAAIRIRDAIGKFAASATAEPAMPEAAKGRHPNLPGSTTWRVSALAVLVLVLMGFGLFLFVGPRIGDRGITIAVSASPTSSDRAAAADYANVAAADLAAFLPTRFDAATVIAPANADRATRAYRMLVTAGRHGAGADASLTLSDRNGGGILWSKSWSVPDSSATDLREQISLAASEAALCLTDARGGASRIDQPALGLYISGCAGAADPAWSDAELVSTFERLVKAAPEFPRGWASLALGRAITVEAQQARSGTADPEAVKNVRQAIAMALKLDPHSGLAYLAQWHLLQDDPLRALAVIDQAVAVAPDEPMVHSRRADSLTAVGRMVDSVAEARRSVELDPLSPFTHAKYIDALTYAGQFSRAKADIADAHRKWPNDDEIDAADFRFQYRYGDPRMAGTLLPGVLDSSDAAMIPFRKIIAARLDPTPAKVDDALAVLRSLNQSGSRDRHRYLYPHDRNPYLLALGLFGRVDESYRLLTDPGFLPSVDATILFRPEFASIRADPRFMQVAARLGLVRYWSKSGQWPDFCTSERLPYDCKAEAAKYG